MEVLPPYSQPRILISGEHGGTGASTVAEILSKILNIPIISGGKYFRGMAHHFLEFQLQYEWLAPENQYRAFLHMYRTVFEELGVSGVYDLIKPFFGHKSSEFALQNLTTQIKQNLEPDGTTNRDWDLYVNLMTMVAVLLSNGFVYEAKTAIAAGEFTEMQPIIAAYDTSTSTSQGNWVVPYIRVLLNVDPSVAAKRISDREERLITKQEVLERKDRDWRRYGEIFTIDGQPAKHRDLYRFADEVIDTEHLTPEQVAQQTIQYYLLKIRFLSQEEQVLARPLIEQLIQADRVLAHQIARENLTHLSAVS